MDPQSLKEATDRARFEGEVTEQLRTLFTTVNEIKTLLSTDRAATEGRLKALELWRSYSAGYIAASGLVGSFLTAVLLKYVG